MIILVVLMCTALEHVLFNLIFFTEFDPQICHDSWSTGSLSALLYSGQHIFFVFIRVNHVGL